MKKSMKIFSVLMGLILTLALAGCELWNKAQELVGPKNTWKLYDEYTYSYNSASVKLKCYLIYVDRTDGYSEDEMSLPNDSRFPGGKLQKGLTVVVMPKMDTDAEKDAAKTIFGNSIVNNKYVIKTFNDGESVAMNDSGEQSDGTHHFKMGYVTWGVIYNSIHTKNASLPSALKADEGYSELTDFENFSWKKLMAAMALQYLTGYLED